MTVAHDNKFTQIVDVAAAKSGRSSNDLHIAFENILWIFWQLDFYRLFYITKDSR